MYRNFLLKMPNYFLRVSRRYDILSSFILTTDILSIVNFYTVVLSTNISSNLVYEMTEGGMYVNEMSIDKMTVDELSAN